MKGLDEGFSGIRSTKEPLAADIIELAKFERVREVDIGGIDTLHLPRLTPICDHLVLKTQTGFHWMNFLDDGKVRRRRVPGRVWDMSFSNSGALIVATHSGQLVFYESYDSKPIVLDQLQDPEDSRRTVTELAADGKNRQCRNRWQ